MSMAVVIEIWNGKRDANFRGRLSGRRMSLMFDEEGERGRKSRGGGGGI